MPSQDARDTALSAALAMILALRRSLFSFYQCCYEMPAVSQSDAGMHRAPKALRAKFTKSSILFCGSFGVRTRPRVAFHRATIAPPISPLLVVRRKDPSI